MTRTRTKTKTRTCDCGGQIESVTGPGRIFKYAMDVYVDVPTDTPTVMCTSCGAYHLGAESDEREQVLAPLYLTKLEEMRAQLQADTDACDAKLRIQFAMLQESRPDISKLAPALVARMEQLRVAPLTRTRALLLVAHLDAAGIRTECSDSISGCIRLDLFTDSHSVTLFVHPSEMSWPGIHVLRLAWVNSGPRLKLTHDYSGAIKSKSFFNVHTLMADLKELQ